MMIGIPSPLFVSGWFHKSSQDKGRIYPHQRGWYSCLFISWKRILCSGGREKNNDWGSKTWRKTKHSPHHFSRMGSHHPFHFLIWCVRDISPLFCQPVDLQGFFSPQSMYSLLLPLFFHLLCFLAADTASLNIFYTDHFLKGQGDVEKD